MTIPEQLTTLERLKFEECPPGGGRPAVRTTICGGTLSATFSGLSVGGKISHFTANATAWQAVPPTALTARNSVSLINLSESVIVYVEYDNAATLGTGWPLYPGQAMFKEITDSIMIYVSTASGTADLTTDETA